MGNGTPADYTETYEHDRVVSSKEYIKLQMENNKLSKENTRMWYLVFLLIVFIVAGLYRHFSIVNDYKQYDNYSSSLSFFEYFVVIAMSALLLWMVFGPLVDHLANKRYEEEAKDLFEESRRLREKMDNLSVWEKEIKTKYQNEYQQKYKKEYSVIFKIKNEKLEESYNKKIEHYKEDLEKLLHSSKVAFPWLAGMIVDYLTFDLERAEQKLSESMSMKIADKYVKVTQLTKQLKETSFQYYNLKYQQEYLFALYPDLRDLIDSETGKLSKYEPVEDSDPIREYLSSAEYASLTEDERNQRALDNYVSSHKKNSWQIGRDYELYVGYRMRSNQFDVKQTGISDKFEDLGRDIIAIKNGIHYIVQCKYWSADKVIREKHIAQLYGTSVCYALENHLSLDRVRCVFYTNIDYSDMAKQFANALSVKLIDRFDLGDYPRIKCKVNYDEYGKTYIYHLPMDQQYDTSIINPDKGDMYAFTVEEAVSHGFRRAYRWHGN